MDPSAVDRAVLDQFYAAMQAGLAGDDAMMDLFAEDAVYVEPFGGETRAHRGRPVIRQVMLDARAYAPPHMTLTVDRIDVDGQQIRSSWTCCSPALESPVHGQDLWTICNGKIDRLETRLVGDAHVASEADRR